MNGPSPDYRPDLRADLARLLARLDPAVHADVVEVIDEQVHARERPDPRADAGRIHRLASVLRAIPEYLNADLLQLLDDITTGRRPGEFRPGAVVAFEHDGRYLHGQVAGKEVGDPPIHQVWIPGEPSTLTVPAGALRHGRPMPHIATHTGIITTPHDAERQLVDRLAELLNPHTSQRSATGDHNAICDTLAIWHRISPEELTALLTSKIDEVRAATTRRARITRMIRAETAWRPGETQRGGRRPAAPKQLSRPRGRGHTGRGRGPRQ